MKWARRPFDSEIAEALSRALNLQPLTGQLLNQRGIADLPQAERFLFGRLKDLPDPFQIEEMDVAANRLAEAIRRREKVLFFGDYDVDGITGTAQLTAFFREIGAPAEPLLPHRLKDGYGLTQTVVKKILLKKPDLVVTIDNGTNAIEEIRALREGGIQVIVIDHHETPHHRPDVVALINPKRPRGSEFQEREIASAGLVFLLLMALRKILRSRSGTGAGEPNLKRYLELAALGTIADIVPLTGTNRLIVKYGLAALSETRWPGLKALMEKGSVRAPVTLEGVAFRIAPRLNAAGRLDDPHLALNLLLSENTDEASALAERLDQLNQQRQQIQERVVAEAVAMIERDQKGRRGLVVAREGWPLGVVGIVAAKLTERFGRPAVVLSIEDGKARGSARTVPGVSVYDALCKISDQMTRFGGHQAAAGMTLPEGNLENFAQKFDESVRTLSSAEAPPFWIDASLPLQSVTAPLLQELALLGPHGPGNPEPLFETDQVELQRARAVGKNHLKTDLSQNGSLLEAIGFNQASYLDKALPGLKHRIAYSPQWNEWNGIRTIQIEIKSISTLNSNS